MTTTLHAHVSTASADCDGRYTRDYVVTLSEQEMAEHIAADGVNDFHDIHFKERVVTMLISVYSTAGSLEFSEHGFDWSEPTEEGYRSAEARWCEDRCDEAVESYRDHTAEAMGY